jgi:dTDP-4-amino-4,6-dideoxygalactose transaminase
MPLPVVERASAEILSLPLFPHITESQIAHVCECLNNHVSAVGNGY